MESSVYHLGPAAAATRLSLYAHSIASPLTTELREDRSRRSASKIERWCPTAREQAALPPGCSHCKTLQVAACGTTLQDKFKKRFAGSHRDSAAVVCPSTTVFTRVRYAMDAATSSPAHGAHRATSVLRRCVLATSKTTAHRRGMEPVCSKSLGVLLQAALAFSGGTSIVCGRFDELGFCRSVGLRSALGVRGAAWWTASA